MIELFLNGTLIYMYMGYVCPLIAFGHSISFGSIIHGFFSQIVLELWVPQRFQKEPCESAHEVQTLEGMFSSALGWKKT